MTEDHLKPFSKIIMKGILEGEFSYAEGRDLLRRIDEVLVGEGELRHQHEQQV